MSRRMLIVRGPTFYSPLDEKMLSEMELRELLAAFYRYRLEMTPLAALKSSRNKRWFAENTDAYWHSKVFGKQMRKRSALKPKRRVRPSA